MGRLRGAITQKAVGQASSQIVDADPSRQSLLLCAPANNQVTLTKTNPAVLGAGLNLNPGNMPVLLTRAQFGDLLDGPFFGIANLATTIGIVEGSYHD